MTEYPSLTVRVTLTANELQELDAALCYWRTIGRADEEYADAVAEKLARADHRLARQYGLAP